MEEIRIVCPKCKSLDLKIVELWKDHSIEWHTEGGSFDRNEGNLEVGNPYRIECTCSKCKYTWHPKGATQISDILKLNKKTNNGQS